MQLNLKTIVAALTMASAVLASPIEHVHHQHEKRAVHVVTRTTLVTVYGNQAGAAPTSTSSVGTPATSYSTTTSAIEVDTPVADTTSLTATTSISSTSIATSEATSTSSSDSGSFGAGAKGITYSPYTASGACKDLSAVQEDLAQLSDYEVIRLYGVDCNQVANVLQAKLDGQKLFLGIYYVDQIESGIQTMASAIESYGSWDDVYTVSIGNELVNSGEATVSQVASYVESGRSYLTAAGYTGSVVSVDTFIAVINNPGLCSISDYMAVNAHAYFDGYTTYDEAGEWVLEQIQRVWNACSGDKNVFITETGWPSQGETYGVAVPSKSNQKAAIASIKESCGNDAIVYTAFNDYWKADGQYGVEKYWGILSDS